MPAPPEFAHRLRDVRIVEILENAKSEHAHQSDGHVRVSGEIEVDLQRVANETQPSDRCGELGGRDGEDLVCDAPQRIGHEHLFAQAEDEAPGSLGDVAEAPLARDDLTGDVLVSDDRSGDELREEKNIEREGAYPALRRRVPASYVDQVRKRMEGEKRDSERQGDGRERYGLPMQGSERDVDIGGREIRVLEYSQQRQVACDAKRQPAAARRSALRIAELAPHGPVEPDRKQHDRYVRSLAPDVEAKTRDQQRRVAPPLRQREVRGEHQRQKQEQEDRRGEDHAPRESTAGRS